MRRWDSLVDAFMTEYEARGLTGSHVETSRPRQGHPIVHPVHITDRYSFRRSPGQGEGELAVEAIPRSAMRSSTCMLMQKQFVTI